MDDDLDDNFATIQFGITLTEDDEPVVVLILPDVLDADGDPLTILIGSGTEATLLASQVLHAGSIVAELAEVMETAEEADLSGIFSDFARRLNAPYN